MESKWASPSGLVAASTAALTACFQAVSYELFVLVYRVGNADWTNASLIFGVINGLNDFVGGFGAYPPSDLCLLLWSMLMKQGRRRHRLSGRIAAQSDHHLGRRRHHLEPHVPPAVLSAVRDASLRSGTGHGDPQ
eukprot:scaffold7092_cov262-Pinguiococcus_pyrenoidosus.AAC.29